MIFKLRTCLLVIASFVAFSLRAQDRYVEDILKDGFVCQSIKMPNAYDGSVFISLVKKNPLQNVNKAILYVHGYNDYFFQSEMANRFIDSGYAFYAVDLRRYGRSYLPHQYPFDVRNISEYFADIDTAVAYIQQEGIHTIFLMGHSTGGLITSLYCDDHKNNLQVSGLILNSPFFDMNESHLTESFLLPLASFWGSIFKNAKINKGLNSIYAESMHKAYHGEWTYDTLMKYTYAPALTAAWMRAIHKAHKKLQRGLSIPCPVLVMYSDKSIVGESLWMPSHHSGDVVLDVKDIKKYSSGIGKQLTQVEIKDGMHDLILSSKPARELTYHAIFNWSGKIVASSKNALDSSKSSLDTH